MTTTQGAIRRLELLLARTPDMECADDLRFLLADAVLSRMNEGLLRSTLESTKVLLKSCETALEQRDAKLTEARRLLQSSEAALQEAQRALFRWLPNRIGSEYDDPIAADAMALMGLESTEGLREVGNEILVELMEKRRLLDDARALVRDSCPFVPQWATVLQKRYASFLADSAAPVPAQPAADVSDICNAYESGVGHAGRPTAKVNPYREGSPEHEAYAIGASGTKHNEQPAAVPAQLDDLENRLLHAKDDPAAGYFGTLCGFAFNKIREQQQRLEKQPAAVPEAVAKDASLSGKEFDALLILLMCSDPWPVGDEANENTMKALATRVAKQYGHDDWIAAYHNHAPADAALLSAADTEVKNG